MRQVMTRIMAVDTETFAVYRPEVEQSTRAGTKHNYIVHGAVTGQLSPVRDSVSLEIYGNRVQQMYTLTCQKGADIQLNDKIQHGGEFYKVIAVLSFTGHVNATIERTGALNNGTA